MTLEFLPDAASELYAAAEYYEARESGLGRRLHSEVMEVCSASLRPPRL
jgi:hypothetical protein